MDTLGTDSQQHGRWGGTGRYQFQGCPVTLVRASVVCAGRFLILVGGDREAVDASVQAARATEARLAGSYVVSNVSSQVLNVLRRMPAELGGAALGVVECRNAADSVIAADKAVKQAAVSLMRMVLGQGIGGKSYFVLTGDVAAVREAAAAAADVLGNNLMRMVVIPQPDPKWSARWRARRGAAPMTPNNNPRLRMNEAHMGKTLITIENLDQFIHGNKLVMDPASLSPRQGKCESGKRGVQINYAEAAEHHCAHGECAQHAHDGHDEYR